MQYILLFIIYYLSIINNKESVCDIGNGKEKRIQSLVWKDSLEEGRATHSVFLPGESYGRKSLVGYGP